MSSAIAAGLFMSTGVAVFRTVFSSAGTPPLLTNPRNRLVIVNSLSDGRNSSLDRTAKTVKRRGQHSRSVGTLRNDNSESGKTNDGDENAQGLISHYFTFFFLLDAA